MIGILDGMASFHIENFGCRAARADGEAISARLLTEGLTEQPVSEADVVVVNTCSVTAEADRDARAFVRKTMRLNPGAKVVVTGCYAQRAPEEIAALDGVAAVVGNSHKGMIPGIVRGLVVASPAEPMVAAESLAAKVWADDSFAHSYIEDAQVIPGVQTRPNLKIQEGCGNRCTFCVIPTTRGASRSLTADKVMSQVQGFVTAGGKELVISGINLGRWGRDFAEPTTLANLIQQILSETDLRRLRLSSIEPMDWTPELIALLKETRIARHAHLPLQSGSDSVLRRMHRRYRPWHYANKTAALIEAVGPELCLGADVMVGFPGETDDEFRETYDLIASLPFAYLHLFPFSPRPGTPGWELHRQSPVAADAVQERMIALRNLAAMKTRDFRNGFVGRSLPAITLHTSQKLAEAGCTSALTDNFLPLEVAGSLPANQLVTIRINGIDANQVLQGETNSLAGNFAVAS